MYSHIRVNGKSLTNTHDSLTGHDPSPQAAATELEAVKSLKVLADDHAA